ncbi:GGDEF domain-containing protein [Luteimonas sp. 3794]|uniref:GGDEF domain-containing protein n=1 Tax=Luteimonas sp. 3794 TaxID=2817730 RepID=UPI00285E2750|nr:GGDEF domain-containing protein [Luteimonas sp. 3794]MDR6990450.1 diguanylate cyclase (GGDEF)-like protein [Luteimonas sp. 3794]
MLLQLSPPPLSVDAATADATAAVSERFSMVYQPIVRLRDHRVVAHEALMRPDDGSSPLQLLGRARKAGTLGDLETRAVRSAVARYDFAGGGLLLLNLSVHAILGGSARPQQVLEALQAGGRDLRNYVVELTERDIVEDCGQLAHAIGYLRAAGVRIALDDFGNGHSNFELWHELSPEFVKIDRFLVHGLADSAGRLNILKALVQVADGFGTELIAEGVERIEDLRVLRDLGIPLVQGYLLGRPSATISRTVSDDVRATADDKIQVWPRDDRPSAFRRILAEHMLIEAPSIRDTATNQDAEALFRQNPQLSAIPVVDRDDVPLGLINRRAFNEHMAMPFARELLGRKPCTTHMNASPVLCDIRQSVDEMSQILLGEDQRYLYDGFVITDNGRYRGVGTGEALVRRVTELRIDAARYANPLTQLPGNIPITEHVRRLVETGQGFVACYCDLNHFKPYNDQYGYFLGDRMLQLLASTLLRHADPRWDFVGHVGGDDFVMLMQSDDWALRCEGVVSEFNAAALALFEPGDRVRGVLEGEDRNGSYATFPLTTLTIGVVQIAAGERSGAEDIASSAARAKREAKRRGLSVHVLGH